MPNTSLHVSLPGGRILLRVLVLMLVGVLPLARLSGGAQAVQAAGTPTISSDQADYGPGSVVALTGTGWQSGEVVSVFVNDDAGQTWSQTDSVTADDSGTFTDTVTLPNWFVSTYSVVATGQVNDTATTNFTDSALTVAESGGFSPVSINFYVYGSPQVPNNNCGGYSGSGAPSGYDSVHSGTLAATTIAANVSGPANGSESVLLIAPLTSGVSSSFLNWTSTGVTDAHNWICLTGPLTGATVTTYTANYTSLILTSISNVSGSATYGDTTATLYATLTTTTNTPISGKVISFSFNGTDVCGGATGVTCPTTNASGVAQLNNVPLPLNERGAGTYPGVVSASFAGDTTYAQSGPTAGDLIVSRQNTNVQGVSGTATYGGKATLYATLNDNSNNPLPNETITFYFKNGANWDAVCGGSTGVTCPTTGDGTGGTTAGQAILSDVPVPSAYANAGPYSNVIKAEFAGDTNYNGSHSTGNLTVSAASTTTTASASSTEITYGQSVKVDYEVSSAYGVLGNNATGTVSVVKDTGPGSLNCSATSTTLSAAQSNADGSGASTAGFDFTSSSDTATYEFTCTPSASGSYTYHVHFADTDGNYQDSSSSPVTNLTVDKAPTNTSATPSAIAVNPGHSITLDYEVSSAYGVLGNNATGTVSVVKDTGPGSLNCSATSTTLSAAQSNADGSGASTAGFDFTSSSDTATYEFTCTPSASGSYTYHVHFADTDGNYQNSDSSTLSLIDLPTDAITNGSCTFDYDGSQAGRQFHLIYTPDQNTPSTWKMNASNPGQFFYDGFYAGKAGDQVTVTVPYPFVTQGAVPVQIYGGFTTSTSNGETCYTPVGSAIATSAQQLVLSGYANSATQQITFTMPRTGYVFFTVHMDYGLKIEYGCTNGGTTNATCTTPNSAAINNLTTYTFTGPGGSPQIQNENVFKKDPGIGGLVVQQGTSNPQVGVQVTIYDGSGHLQGTATTDVDGWYMWSYKYTGKAASFVVKASGQSQSVTLKSNGFLVVTFQT